MPQGHTDSSPVQLAIFDDCKGGSDADPSDQMLAYFPDRVPKEEQAGAAGLMRALQAFTSIFTDEPSADISMDAQKHQWVTHTAEPHTTLLLVADTAWCGTVVRDSLLRDILRQIHSAITLLHGGIQRLCRQDTDGARQVLDSILAHYGDALLQGSPHVLDRHNPLSQPQSVPYFDLTPRTATGVQALCDGLLLLPTTPGGAGGSVAAAVAMHVAWCLCSSAAKGDTAALVSLARGALLQHGRAPQPLWMKLKGAALATAGRSPISVKQRPSELPLDSHAWVPAPDGFPSCFLHLGTASHPSDGGDAVLCLPRIHLQGDSEVCALLPLQLGDMTLLLLMAEEWRPTPEACAAVAVAVEAPLQQLSPAVAADIAAAHGGHLKGFRYLVSDELVAGVRASPPVKTATLHRDTAAIALGVQSQLDERCIAAGPPSEDVDVEMVVRGAGDAWVAGRVAGRRRMCLVMEGRGEGGLQEATATAARFAAQHAPGVF